MYLATCLFVLFSFPAMAEHRGSTLPSADPALPASAQEIGPQPLVLSVREFARRHRSAMMSGSGGSSSEESASATHAAPVPPSLIPQLLETFADGPPGASRSEIAAAQASIDHLVQLTKDAFTAHALTKQAGAPFDPSIAVPFAQMFNFKAIVPGDGGGGGGGGGSSPGAAMGGGGSGGGAAVTYGGSGPR